MPLAVTGDLIRIRALWNLQQGVMAQVTNTWNPLPNLPQQSLFVRYDGARVAAVLLVRLAPHPNDRGMEPEMVDWLVNPLVGMTIRIRALWGCALDMADFYKALGYHRTFGRARETLRRFVLTEHPGFTAKGEWVVADDRAETMDFLRNRS